MLVPQNRSLRGSRPPSTHPHCPPVLLPCPCLSCAAFCPYPCASPTMPSQQGLPAWLCLVKLSLGRLGWCGALWGLLRTP